MSSEVLLGTVLDADTDPVEVYHDAWCDVVILRWEHGTDMVFGRTGRDKLRELLDRAAVPGQRAPEADRRMAKDGNGNVKPVSEFGPNEKWWCDGEDCGGLDDPDLPVPHVHCEMHCHPVDLLTGKCTDGGHGLRAAMQGQDAARAVPGASRG